MPSARRRSRGFTLIELGAVVLLIALISAFGLPRLTGSKWRQLRDEAESIASSLEFARQRAIMTGKPHRLLVDLEEGGYRVEWLVTEELAFEALVGRKDSEFDDPMAALLDDSEEEPISLAPPPRPEIDFHPIPNREMGSFRWLDEAIYFVGLDTPGGWIEGGDVEIVFDADGTTEFALLEIADSDDHHLTLEIEPLLDRVRRRQGKARS
jgi:prepilin-type N-terminal cleavage/methylation domain-containing protein